MQEKKVNEKGRGAAVCMMQRLRACFAAIPCSYNRQDDCRQIPAGSAAVWMVRTDYDNIFYSG